MTTFPFLLRDLARAAGIRTRPLGRLARAQVVRAAVAVLPRKGYAVDLAARQLVEADQRPKAGQMACAGAEAREQRVGIGLAHQLVQLAADKDDRTAIAAGASLQHPAALAEERQ